MHLGMLLGMQDVLVVLFKITPWPKHQTIKLDKADMTGTVIRNCNRLHFQKNAGSLNAMASYSVILIETLLLRTETRDCL